jgi:hypothetical protein
MGEVYEATDSKLGRRVAIIYATRVSGCRVGPSIATHPVTTIVQD